jgi:hypothetical protein
MMKFPAGTTTISGQSGQSRNTAPGSRPDGAAAGVVTAACATENPEKWISHLFIPCGKAATVGMSATNSQKTRNGFISVTPFNSL